MAKRELDRQLGLCISDLRARRGLTQQQLAAATGLAHGQTICDLETGKRALKATELVRLAGFFGVAPEAILAGTPIPPERVLWREAGEFRPEDREKEQRLFLTRCRRYAFLERLAGTKPRRALPSYVAPTDLSRLAFSTVESWAEAVRADLELGARPSRALRTALETECRVKIFFSDLTGGSGLTAKGDFGNGICLKSSELPWRRHFSLAHELFHLITWDSVPENSGIVAIGSKDRNETLADVFASCLLLPQSALEPFLSSTQARKGVQGMALLETAREFGVSTEALMWRMVNLGMLDREAAIRRLSDSRLKVLDRAFRGGVVKPERVFPDRFVALAVRCFAEGKISTGKLAEVMETTIGNLGVVLEQYGFDLNSDAYEAQIISA